MKYSSIKMMIMDFISPVHNVECLSIAMFCRALSSPEKCDHILVENSGSRNGRLSNEEHFISRCERTRINCIAEF